MVEEEGKPVGDGKLSTYSLTLKMEVLYSGYL
jgi:hypothetical protein